MSTTSLNSMADQDTKSPLYTINPLSLYHFDVPACRNHNAGKIQLLVCSVLTSVWLHVASERHTALLTGLTLNSWQWNSSVRFRFPESLIIYFYFMFSVSFSWMTILFIPSVLKPPIPLFISLFSPGALAFLNWENWRNHKRISTNSPSLRSTYLLTSHICMLYLPPESLEITIVGNVQNAVRLTAGALHMCTVGSKEYLVRNGKQWRGN